ncbi:MAG: methylcobalamin:coenzyme M methyltransferase [bacterium ADurb.Bin243]|nr:MAG: methylcobalamin:coenzyme M methyltransferase [bacterium ADurb.Bin243]
MNSLERTMAAVTGKPYDRRAVGLTLSLYGARLTGCPLYEFYTDADKYVQGQLAVKKTFDTDIFYTPFVLTAITEAFGGEVKYFKASPPNMSKPAFKSGAGLSKFDFSNVTKHPRLAYLLEAAKRLADSLAADNAVAAVFLSPIDIPPLIMGIDAWLETILFNETEAKKIMELTGEFFVKMANAFFASGAHFVALPVVFCNPAIITRRIVDETAIPVLRENFSKLNGPIVLHHGGAPMTSFIDSLASLPNVIGYAIDQADKFRDARSLLGEGKTLLGNIDGPTLNKKTPGQIAAQCANILKDRAGDPHFIFSSSGADIPMDTPPENITAVVEAVKKFYGVEGHAGTR